MEVIRPLKLGTLTLPDSESRLVCRTILLDMLGEATITVEDGDLAGVTGLVWKHQELSLATVYLPRTALRLTAHGVGRPDIVMLRATDGPLIVHHRKQSFEMAPRDVILLPSDMMSEIVLPEGGRLDCAHLPHAGITLARKSVDRILLRPFSAECLPLQLLTNYAGYLLRQDHQDKEHASMMVAHFYSLLPVLAQYVAEAAPSAVPHWPRTPPSTNSSTSSSRSRSASRTPRPSTSAANSPSTGSTRPSASRTRHWRARRP